MYRKLWKVAQDNKVWRPESKVKAYNIVQAEAANWQCNPSRSPMICVYVDERDDQSWQLYEVLNLRELPTWK